MDSGLRNKHSFNVLEGMLLRSKQKPLNLEKLRYEKNNTFL